MEVHLCRIRYSDGKDEGGGVTELWLMRHGETEWSASGRHTSRTDVLLTEQGRERAKKLGAYLAGTSFAAVLCSPMQRARETCAIAGFGDVAVIDKGLCEWDYGVFEGRTTAEIQTEIPGWSVWTNPITGGETLQQVGARADAVIARALGLAEAPAAGGDGTAVDSISKVALFAHAHILRILAARWIGLQPRGGELFSLGTGSLSVLGWERETRVIDLWNRGFEE
jgi:probable phosphoglycerate mutase